MLLLTNTISLHILTSQEATVKALRVNFQGKKTIDNLSFYILSPFSTSLWPIKEIGINGSGSAFSRCHGLRYGKISAPWQRMTIYGKNLHPEKIGYPTPFKGFEPSSDYKIGTRGNTEPNPKRMTPFKPYNVS